MSSGLPGTIYDNGFASFDPYSIFQNQNKSTIGKLGLDYVTKTAKKKIISVITFHDSVFGLTDTMIAGLVKVWKNNTRERNKKLLRSLVKFHVQHPSMDIETGLYTLMILASLPIGKTTLAWHSQLQNPIRGKAIWSFVRNVPKSISEGSNYFDNVGKDLLKEQEIPCKYYFDELNKTLVAYLSLTCLYLNKDPKLYFRKLESSGYEWLDISDAGTKDIFNQMYKYVFLKSTLFYQGQTIADIYRGFDMWGKMIKVLYKQIGQPMEDACQYVTKHGKDYLWAFSSFEEKEKEEKAQQKIVSRQTEMKHNLHKGQTVIWQCASGDETVTIDICQKNGRTAFCMKAKNRPMQVDLYEINRVYSVKRNVLNISADTREYKLAFRTSEEADAWKRRLKPLVKGYAPSIPNAETGKLIAQGESEPCTVSMINRQGKMFFVIELRNRPFRAELASVDELKSWGGNRLTISCGGKEYTLEFSSNARRQLWAEYIGNLL